MIGKFFRRTVIAIRRINRKYAKPQIRMTRGTKLALGLLRGYLLFLVALIVYKFVVTVTH